MFEVDFSGISDHVAICSALAAICNAVIWGKGQYLCLVEKGRVGNGGIRLYVYSLLTVTILLLQFSRNVPYAKFGCTHPYFGRTGVRWGSAMVPSDRTLASSYRLSIVSMPLPAAVSSQFAMQVFGGAVSTSV